MRVLSPAVLAFAAPLALLPLTGCPNVTNPGDETEPEVITTVTLTFSPDGGGADVVAKHADPENDGSPVIDPITLTNGTAYTLTLAFTNELEDPAEDITAEVEDESADHQVLIYGGAVSGPAAGDPAGAVVDHAYDDTDANGFPVGLANTVTASAVGSGDFKVMLRHMPPEDDVAVKNASVAADFASGGSAGIGGDVDVDVTFALTVE